MPPAASLREPLPPPPERAGSLREPAIRRCQSVARMSFRVLLGRMAADSLGVVGLVVAADVDRFALYGDELVRRSSVRAA